MDTSQPSRPQGKRKSAAADARRASRTYWVAFTLKDEAAPLAQIESGATVLTDGGRKVADCWKSLGVGRPYLETDAVSIGPRTVQGIFRIASGHPGAQALPMAARLFKLLSARALVEPGRSGPGNRSAAGIWKKGFAEKPLDTLKQVVEARSALKLTARTQPKP